MNFIEANWPAPKHIKAFTTVRNNGLSQPPYHSCNLAEHVGDDAQTVLANRVLLKSTLDLTEEPIWLEQTHSTIALPALPEHRGHNADASFTASRQRVCVVLTADCLPILVCDRKGTHVAAIHAGWRGLVNGVIENTLAEMNVDPADLLVWLGPAISGNVYEVGDEVKQHFITAGTPADLADIEAAFLPSPKGRWLANLYLLATQRLAKKGVTQIFGGEYCTFRDKELFYSYRRDGAATGRMASLIYMA